MKKICIDLRMIESSGIGTYLQNLVPNLIKDMTSYHFILLGNKEIIRKYVKSKNVTIITFEVPIYSLKEQIMFRKIPIDYDIIWAPHYNIPIFSKKKLITTIHDVFHLAFASELSLIQKLYSKIMFTIVKHKSSKIITVSNFSKNELKKYLNIDEGKIHVIYNGVKSNRSNKKYELNDELKKDSYIIFIGNVKPHKNLLSLIKSIEILGEKFTHKLIIVGKKEGFLTGDKNVIEYAKKFSNKIKFTGYISEEELTRYLNNADLLVFPSLYEGFGLPPLEAMAAGCPVITSDIASMPEVCGDAAIYFNPLNPNSIAKAILEVLNNKEIQNSLIKKGLKRVKKFSWEQSLMLTKEILIKELEN